MNNLSHMASAAVSGMLLVASSLLMSAQQHEHKHNEHREHGTHEHGTAILNVAIEESSLYLELESPAMNIVGFEHSPKNHEQRHAVEHAVTQLENGSALFVLTPAAQCRLAKADVESPLLESKHHEHEKHGEKETHSEFHATYIFNCKNIGTLKEMDVQLFNKFKATEEIRVQLVTGKGQTVKELTPTHSKLTF